MNIPSSLGRYFDYSKPVPTLKADAAKDRHVAGYSNGGRLGKILKDKRFVEVEPSAPTRYNSINNTGSTIDRILINTAPCFVRQSQWASVILNDPRGFFLLAFLTTGWCNVKLLLPLYRNQERAFHLQLTSGTFNLQSFMMLWFMRQG